MVFNMTTNIFIRTLEGITYNFDVNLEDDVLSFKKIIEKKISICHERQRLIYCGQELMNDKKMNKYGIENETNLHLVFTDEREFWNKKIKILMNDKLLLEQEIEKLKKEKDLQLLNEQKNEINEIKAIEKIKEEYAKLVKNMIEGEIKINLDVNIYTPQSYCGLFRSFEFNFINNCFEGLTPSDNSTIQKIYPEIELARFASHLPFCKKIDVKLLNSSNIASFNYIYEKHCLKINSSIAQGHYSGRTTGTFEITLHWSKK